MGTRSNLLDHVPLFANLTPEEKDTLSTGLVEHHCQQGEVLLQVGETGDTLHIIAQGFVSLSTPDGQTLATLGPGSVIGEMALFLRTPSEVNITALSALDTWELSDARLREILEHRPAIALRLRPKLGGLPVQMKDYLLQRMERAPGFTGVKTPVLQALAGHMQLHELKADEPILQMGKIPSGLFLLDSGEIALNFPGHVASSYHARRIRSGELMGTLPLLTGKPSTYNGVAIQDCLIWLLPAQKFHDLAGQHPGLRRALARHEYAPLSETDQSTAQSLLTRTPLFAGLPPEARQRIAAVMTQQHVAAGERVYSVGQSCAAIYCVEEGEVAISTQGIGGTIVDNARIDAQEFFGEQGLASAQSHNEDATALRHTTLWLLSQSGLEELSARFPGTAKALKECVAAHLATEKPDPIMESLRQVALLAELTKSELQHVASFLHPQKFAAGTKIYQAGSPGEALYLLRSGQVRIRPTASPAWFINPGEVFGERALLHNAPHDEGAEAEKDTEVWVLHQEDFTTLIAHYPSLAYNLTRQLSRRLDLMAGEPHTITDLEVGTVESGHWTRAIREGPFWIVVGDWFANQSTFGKLRTGLIVCVVLWGLSIGTLLVWQALRGSGTALASPLDMRSAILAVQSMGSYELARQDRELAEALALADRMAPPTPLPTLPPTVTPTPLPTATPTNTPLPTATPTATNTPAPVVVQQAAPQEAAPPEPASQVAALPSRSWDPRLDRLGVVVEEPAVPSGQPYWRLVEAIWQDEQESAGKHHIYVEVLDENGNRVVGQPVTAYWADGNFSAATEDKQPPDYAFNYQMYATGNAYHVKVEGLPSDIVHGVGMGSIELPDWSIHTSFLLTFQRTIKP